MPDCTPDPLCIRLAAAHDETLGEQPPAVQSIVRCDKRWARFQSRMEFPADAARDQTQEMDSGSEDCYSGFWSIGVWDERDSPWAKSSQ